MQGIIQCARHILVIRQTICGMEDGRQQSPSTIPEPECLFPVSTAYLFSCHVIQCNLDYLTDSEELSSQQQAAFQIQVVQVQSKLQSAYRPRAPSRGIYVQYLCLDGIVWQFLVSRRLLLPLVIGTQRSAFISLVLLQSHVRILNKTTNQEGATIQ